MQPEQVMHAADAKFDHARPWLCCLQQKGIYVPDKSCAAAKNVSLNFMLDNAYYAWERVINKPDGTLIQLRPTSASARRYTFLTQR